MIRRIMTNSFKTIAKISVLAFMTAGLTAVQAESLYDLYDSLIAKKRTQIEQVLNLQDNAEFWQVYDEFQNKQSEYDRDAFKLIEKFHKKQEADEINAQSMINLQAEFFRIEGRILQNKQNQAEFFGKTMSKEEMFIFYEIEAKLEALIRSEIAKKSPLIAPNVTLK